VAESRTYCQSHDSREVVTSIDDREENAIGAYVKRKTGNVLLPVKNVLSADNL
jgi:hypothetical protein